MDMQPFTISIPQDRVDDLKTRLNLARFPDELDESNRDLGTPLAEVKHLVTFWKDSFDWRKAESSLNKEFSHYITSIAVDGFQPLSIHFIHRRSTIQNAIPLLFVHGWPGSFLEGTKIVNQLSGDGKTDPAFHVVIISLPNFGFSQGPNVRGFALEQYAETCHKLMLKLGYSEYATQGGDWGYYITRTMSLLYPNNCKATHLNMNSITSPPSILRHPLLALEHFLKPYTPEEKAGLDSARRFAERGSGYRVIQTTRPQTIAYALTDSPVSLLAWIYEKLKDWADDYPWTEEEVCTWLSIYWFSVAGPGASVRIYHEVVEGWSRPNAKISRERLGEWIDHVKIGYSHQPHELRVVPRLWIRQLGDVVFERKHDSGGHFFAWEKPELLIADLREMFKKGSASHISVSHMGYI
ncbi:hypothetical protein Plec18170_007195 [Paecilomyces lecythidis]